MPWTKTGNIRGPTGPQGATGSGILPADTTIAAATRIISNSLVATDTQPAWQVMGSGQFNWGPGGSTAPDTSLYRSGAAVLTTTAGVFNGPANFDFRAAGDVYLTANGGSPWIRDLSGNYLRLNTSDGSLTYNALSNPRITFNNDTNLYRAAVNDLRTDGSFMAGQHIQSAGGGANRIMLNANGTMYFGGAADTNLYRTSAG